MDEWKLGYFAGILDGEGSIAIGRFHREKYPTIWCYSSLVYIGNTHLGLLEELNINFPGKLTKVRDGSAFWRPFYRLSWSGNRGKEILLPIMNRLIVKKEQASLYLAFPLRPDGGTTSKYPEEQADLREQIYLRLKELNGKITISSSEDD